MSSLQCFRNYFTVLKLENNNGFRHLEMFIVFRCPFSLTLINSSSSELLIVTGERKQSALIDSTGSEDTFMIGSRHRTSSAITAMGGWHIYIRLSLLLLRECADCIFIWMSVYRRVRWRCTLNHSTILHNH